VVRNQSQMSLDFTKVKHPQMWIGIIMYLPTQNPELRRAIEAMFNEYAGLMDDLGKKYKMVPHWAKTEIPNSIHDLEELRNLLNETYDLDEYRQIRHDLDPRGILANYFIRELLIKHPR
jgi:uncharacterized membrane-anchored protein YhcB (DUF1043 family)